MDRNPEFYRPRDKDQAYHPQPGEAEAQQWWYYDGVFTNGYSIQISFFSQLTRTTAHVWLHICEPNGNCTNVMPVFPLSKVVASTETLDVKIGDNHTHGKFPRYEVHFRSGDTGADLVYECITQEVMEPPDGVYLGRQQCPATPVYYAYVLRPRCRITGKLIMAGKEIPVQGEGYGDHQWINAGTDTLPNHYWYWGKVYLPKHTIFWWDTQLSQTFGYQRVKWLWALKGERLFEYLRDADYYVESRDLEADPESGVIYPRKMVLMIDERRIKGTATYTMKHIVFKFPPQPLKKPIGWRRYFRYLSDCHSEFEIEGEKIEADTKEIHEIAV